MCVKPLPDLYGRQTGGTFSFGLFFVKKVLTGVRCCDFAGTNFLHLHGWREMHNINTVQ